MPLDIAVIGTGHVGLITAGTLARVGHRVIGVDDNKDTIDSLNAGRMPFFEAGTCELIAQAQASGRLPFTGGIAEEDHGNPGSSIPPDAPAPPPAAPHTLPPPVLPHTP